MKILHVVQCYHPAVGGSEWLVKNLSELLVSRYGDEVTVFTAAADKPAYFWRQEGSALPAGTEVIQGVAVRRFKVFRRLRRPRMLLAHTFHRLRLPYHDWARTLQLGPLISGMTQAIADSDADVVFATSFPFLHMYYALAGARQADRPAVLLGAIHALDKWGYDRDMMYQAIHQAQAYIAHTTFERDHLIGRGVAAEKITVIGGGVDVEPFLRADGAAERGRYGWGDEPVIAAVARQSVLKRLDTLLYAMPRVWAIQPRARLLFAGARTSYSAELEQIIQRLPPEQQARVTIVNNFSEAEKPGLLAACDLLVHPSANESFGIALIEAWACAKAVIGANAGAIPSVIDEERDGLLFEYEDPDSLARAILALLADEGRRYEMGQAGRKKVLGNYTWDIVTDRFRTLYEEVVARHRKRAVSDARQQAGTTAYTRSSR